MFRVPAVLGPGETFPSPFLSKGCPRLGSRYWHHEGPGRHADVYVFVHQKHTDKATLNPLDLTQFDFYVVPTAVVEARWPGWRAVSLAAVREVTRPIRYAELRREIEAL